MDDEVSVAELLVREGWGDDESPAARSRWRVVAVMLAVVIGCGTAAVLVAFNGTPREDAQQVDQIRVIPMPERTTRAYSSVPTNKCRDSYARLSARTRIQASGNSKVNSR